MCGICGFFGKKKNKREIVEKMKEKLVHRGPDAQGSFVNDSVALGFRRLSIIDLEGGLQPMKSSSQNLTVVFNGEIYNYQELREQMEREKKILFVTRSDTETLVNGLEAYGPAFVEQLRGMFAFAVWNEKKEELMLARDFFGIKPLFYTVVDGNFVFASEIKSILQFPGVPKKLNERALEQYLSFQYSVLEETFFEGIYRLPPGCMLFYRQGKYEICRYFQPKLQPEAGCSLADMEKKLESVLKKSVRRHMVSDVEVRRCGFGFYCRVVRGKNGVYGGISGWEQRLQRGKQGQGGGPVCASFLSHAYYREKGVLGCASKGNVRPRRAQR